MVAPSKIFQEPLNCFHCSQFLLHPGIGCFRYFLKNFLTHGVGGLKYFSPLLFTPLVLKYKVMNRELFYQALKHYLQTVFWSTLATASAFLWICCLRYSFGKFRPKTTLFMPTVFGLQFSWFFPPRVLKLFTTATTQATLESLLLQNSNKLTHLILHSTWFQTILFMLNSAIILHYKRKNVYKEFWFIETHAKLNEVTTKTNNQVIQNENENPKIYNEKHKTNCDHKNISCRKFVLDGMKTYLFYGIPLDLLGMFMKNKLSQGTRGLIAKLKGKLHTFRPLMTAFFLSYVGIYRLSSCFFRKYYNNLSLDLQHMMSAFLGGFSFVFVKRINFILLSLVISTQLIWQQFCNSIKTTTTGRKPNLVLMILKNFPLSQMFLSINCGYLVHNYILNYHLVNSLARGFLDGLTAEKPKNIRNLIVNNNKQSLIEMGKLYPVKIFL